MTKKAADAKDWARAYIKYRIAERYGSMSALARLHGLHHSVVRRALRVPYPQVDRVIAEALGVSPDEIWPSRYNHATVASNPRLWRRWINVKPSTGEGELSVNSPVAG